MTKIGIVILGFCSLAIFMPWVCSGLTKEEIWSETYCQGKEKVTKLHFYLQDLIRGPNKTVYTVAKSELTDSLPSQFGRLLVLDNLITAGPEPDSKKVGRMQGIVGLSNLHELSLAMLLNVVFTEGKYDGSTLSILGRNPLTEKVREVSIVGGTGVFRMARGYVITSTHSFDGSLGVYEYTVFVSHLEDGAS